LHEANKCRALFATHYHELTSLASKLDGLANATVKVKDWQGEVIFLHEVVAGVADRSYGIQVAKLAGLPQAVTKRAASILAQLEKSERASKRETLIDDLPLFAVVNAAPEQTAQTTEIENMLTTAKPDEMSPRDALDFIYALKTKLGITQK
jgi:DNA mismatch repair protein MutS